NTGTVYALNPDTGATIWSFATNDGPVKGFINPDFTGNGMLYFTTTNKVWGLLDNGASATQVFSVSMPAPSIPLFNGAYLLVGSGDGKLYQFANLTSATPTSKSITLGGGTAVVGSPSFDFNNNMAYVGTDAGAIYAVAIPLP